MDDMLLEVEDESRSPDRADNKARKACINCRKQKMKCRIDNGDTCRRCQRSGVPCIFIPRANAARSLDSLALLNTEQAEINTATQRRLKAIEEYLGLSEQDGSRVNSQLDALNDGPGEIAEAEPSPEDRVLRPLWEATACLQKIRTSSFVDPIVWNRTTIRHLWLTFHDTMPGLHFLPSKQKFSSPRPLLLASILYCSSARGSAEVAHLAPNYFTVLCNAIAQLSLPDSGAGRPPEEPAAAEEWAFQTVLGIILAGVLTEGRVRETGLWISVAYRLILEYCPAIIDERSREWRELFVGAQIIDLEHASLHMSCPVIPIEPPLPTLRLSHRDQLYRLSRMMHTGLTHFSGRGLPTIWSCLQSPPPDTSILHSTSSFTAVDAAVIRDWARQLDDWLFEFSNSTHDTEHDRTLVFRQYVLHRLVVLSIYHPARGCNLFSNTMTPKEQVELLLSARATLKLHINDTSIWGNWDLSMITWAALIVLQGVEGGVGDPDDLRLIRIHLNMLRDTNEPKPSFREKLVARLEHSLQGVQTPSPPTLPDPIELPVLSPGVDYAWQIFDQASLQQLTYPT